MSALDDLLRQPRPATASADPVGVQPARVVRSDAGGVFAAVIGSSTATPLGPCRAATYLRETSTTTGAVTSYRYTPTPLPVGALVLLASTEAGVWVVRYEL